MHPLLARWLKRRPAVLAMTAAAIPVAAVPFSISRAPVASVHRLRMRVDPSDQQRTLISGRMSDVCDALDAMVLRQQA
jgi:hypothetical protein